MAVTFAASSGRSNSALGAVSEFSSLLDWLFKNMVTPLFFLLAG